jgi:hypothetical protein
MEMLLKIRPPVMPNSFQYEVAPRPREDGARFNSSIPIEELNEQQATEFGEMMKQEFIKHWKDKKFQQSSQW